jgi:hypothetical protein
MLELAKMLKLVAPISMTADAQLVWLQAAIDALEGIQAHEVAAVSAELRRSVTRPSQIVPEIAKLVDQKRKRTVHTSGLGEINAKREAAGLGAVEWVDGRMQFVDAPECSLGKRVK